MLQKYASSFVCSALSVCNWSWNQDVRSK